MFKQVSLAVGLALSAPCAAQAHAQLEKANPRVGASIPVAPAEVSLWFSDEVDADQSEIVVTNAEGAVVSVGKARQGDADNALSISIQARAAGTYAVRWRAFCDSRHRTQGQFYFEVKP